MHMREKLRSREQLAGWLAAVDLADDAPAILTACDRQALFHYDNICALERCYTKAWRRGERLLPADLTGITVDRMLLLKVLAALLAPLIRARHAEMNLPESVTGESCRALGQAFRAMAEYPDALMKNLHWTGKYYRDIMFKTGIFVYRLARLSEKLPVWGFRQRATGRVLALASDGVKVDREGLICVDDAAAPEFTTSLRRTSREITGNLARADGRIVAQRVTLAPDDWENVLAPEALTAEIHIPPGRPMVGADCGASMRAAAEIIRRHLPQHDVRCFTCMSWILNPEWLELLPASNMARFMRELYLFPIRSSPTAGIDFVFRKSAAELDLKTAPRQSRLQRVMLEKLEKREPLHAGGMFMLLDDVAHFGTQYYVTHP